VAWERATVIVQEAEAQTTLAEREARETVSKWRWRVSLRWPLLTRRPRGSLGGLPFWRASSRMHARLKIRSRRASGIGTKNNKHVSIVSNKFDIILFSNSEMTEAKTPVNTDIQLHYTTTSFHRINYTADDHTVHTRNYTTTTLPQLYKENRHS
jgi:hypothetical protein